MPLWIQLLLFVSKEGVSNRNGLVQGKSGGTFLKNCISLSFHAWSAFLHSVHKCPTSGGFRRFPELPTDLLQWKNLCKRPAATQRDVTDGRVAVPSSDGLPRWRGIRELEAELWKLFPAHFTCSHWQSHTLLSCAFGGWRSQMRGLISPRKSSLVWAPAVLFQRGRCHQATNCTQSSFLTLVWRWLSNGHLRAIYNWRT